jgi:hypothetical protein
MSALSTHQDDEPAEGGVCDMGDGHINLTRK